MMLRVQSTGGLNMGKIQAKNVTESLREESKKSTEG
jgi:hypothetical protein